MSSKPLAVQLTTALILSAACQGPGLPPGFGIAAAGSPSDWPCRLWLDGDAIAGAAVPLGPGAVPAEVRVAAEAIAPAGELVFRGREWRHGEVGFRIEKRYREDGAEQFRSVLLDETGRVRERSHSVPLSQVPPEILVTAMHVGRDVLRCEVVSGPVHEEGWRATVRDRLGLDFVVTIDLFGEQQTVHRVVQAALHVR